MDAIPYILAGVGGLWGVTWWLLQNKDRLQEKQISALWEKHDQDAAALAALKLEIAKEHYIKGELDQKFDKLEHAFTGGMDGLGKKFDQLASSLLNHMQREDSRQ